jgi:hypothetical protein
MREHLGRIRTARVRLVGTGSPTQALSGTRRGGGLYRPLIVGPAILSRSPESLLRSERGIPRGAWHVDLLGGGGLLPDAPRRPIDLERVVAWRQQRGESCRVGAALVSCCDVTTMLPEAPIDEHDDRRDPFTETEPTVPWLHHSTRVEQAPGLVEIYGWALMYRLPGMIDAAAIDPHDEFDDLPAYFNSPLELVDRAAFLASKGIPNRPIALLTQRGDFHPRSVTTPRPINRFRPEERFRRPADLRRLFA